MALKQLTKPVLWKRFTTDSIETYKGLPGEPIVDMRASQPVVRLCDGLTEMGHPIGVTVDLSGIARPLIIAPLDGATDVVLAPSITASEFNGILADGTQDTHAATYWEVSKDSDFTNLVYQSGKDSVNLTTIDLGEALGDVLEKEVTYFVRVAYEGGSGLVSEWSASISFATEFPVPDTFVQKLVGSDATGSTGFGVDIAVSGDLTTALIAADHSDGTAIKTGAVYVFENTDNGWVETGKLPAPNPGADLFGSGVAISRDGSLAIVGAMYDGTKGSRAGAVYAFKRIDGVWTNTQKLTASDGATDDRFGVATSLSADGAVAIIGAQDDDDADTQAGAAYVFERNGDTWTEVQKLTGSDTTSGDRFGISTGLSADGTLAVIGAHADDDNGGDSGSVYVFMRQNDTWVETQKLTASDGASGDLFGLSADMAPDGDLIIVGAPKNNDVSGLGGAAYLYKYNGTKWVELQVLSGPGPWFGNDVALSGNGGVGFIGIRYDDENGTDAGAVHVYK